MQAMRKFMLGMGRFMMGMWRLPIAVRIWLGWLALVNGVAPLFFLDLVEAQVVLAIALGNVALMGVLTAQAGFTRLLGLGHVLWIPLLGYVWLRLGHHPAGDPVGIWLRLLLLLNGISVILDAIDVLRFVRGDRAELVAGLSPPCCRGA